jgi:hypothetical protein
MSAEGFGGTNPTYSPPPVVLAGMAPPAPPDPEYLRQGPGLNAATMLWHGWISAHEYQLSSGASAEFDIATPGPSLGSPTPRVPQVVRIHVPNGDTFAVEFRDSNSVWDHGLPSPLVCVSQGDGSTADGAHPGTGSATYRAEIRVPFALGSPQSRYFDPAGFTVEVLDVASPQARVRISPGSKDIRPVTFDTHIDTLDSTVVETGTYTYKKGEHWCLEGAYPWSRLRNHQRAVFTLRYGDARRFHVNWRVSSPGQIGPALTGTSGVVNLVGSKFVTPVPEGHNEYRAVTVGYEIGDLPDGSVLRLVNVPADGSYSREVTWDFVSSVGSATAFTTPLVVLDGETLHWGDKYYRDLFACLAERAIEGRRNSLVRTVLPSDLWGPMGPVESERAQLLLDAYAGTKSASEREEILAMVRQVVGRSDIEPLIISAKGQSIRPPHIDEHDDRVNWSGRILERS